MKKAVVVEDDENNMLLVTDLLEMSGYVVIQARSGKEGLEVIFSEKPDFVILDIGLPDMMGTEVVKQLRASEKDGKLPVIAMTSFAMSGDRKRLMDAGCNGYIEKPIYPEKVIEQIRAIIGE